MTKFEKTKVAVLTTTVALASALGVSQYKDKSIEALENEIDSKKSFISEREEVIMELQNTVVYKSEKLLEIEGDLDYMQYEYNNLEEDYKKTKGAYEKNLVALNNAEKKLKAQETKKVQASKPTTYTPKEYTSWKKMLVESTAYTKYENGDELAGRKWGDLTASGQKVRYGIIAVDTNVIPLGTEVYIPALNKVFVALDTGSAINGNKIDIYFDSLQQCVSWGRKYGMEIYVNI